MIARYSVAYESIYDRAFHVLISEVTNAHPHYFVYDNGSTNGTILTTMRHFGNGNPNRISICARCLPHYSKGCPG